MRTYKVVLLDSETAYPARLESLCSITVNAQNEQHAHDIATRILALPYRAAFAYIVEV